MQFARFLNRGATGLARDGNELFRGEFFALHFAMMQDLAVAGCSILLILQRIGLSKSHIESFIRSEQK